MNQALHVFSKDVRRLWLPVSIALAVQALFTFLEMRTRRGWVFSPYHANAENLVDLMLPVAWWYLISALVHEEPLPGDRQFWITRPYAWKSLLAAKLLFIFVFVNVVVLISDCLILTAHGFSAGAHWEGILWRQVPFAIPFLLLPLALGSLTRNLGQVIVAVLLIVLRIIVNSIPFQTPIPEGSTAVNWTEGTVDAMLAFAVLAVVVLIQYRSRRTWLARGLLAAFVIVPGFSLPVRWQLGWQARVKPPAIDTSPIRIVFDPARGRHGPRDYRTGVTYIAVDLPVTVRGSPDGVELVSSQADVEVGGKDILEGAELKRDEQGYWEGVMIPEKVSASLGDNPVTIRISPVVTALRRTEYRAPLDMERVEVPGLGICESWRPGPQFLFVECEWALRNPLQTHIHADYPGWDTRGPNRGPQEQVAGFLSDSPYPADLSLSPVQGQSVLSLGGADLEAATNHPGTQLVFELRHPIAHFQTEIEMKPVRLGEYAVVAPKH